ncbi:MAG: hypothetical protein J5930_09405 [Treponema sp.]|nr:hypothetical protein [Treponema sp.]MBO5608096.1 hypothetical protein [Treponema sp.]
MTVGERDQFNRFIKALEGISGELRGIRKCLEKQMRDESENSTAVEINKVNKNDHRED